MPLALWAVLCVLAAADIGTLQHIVEIILVSPETNSYAIQFCSGPWYRYVVDFLLLSPWPTLLGLGQVGVTLLRLKEGRCEPLPLLCVVLCAGLLFEYAFFTKVVRYLAFLDLPVRILAVTLLCELLAVDSARWHAAVAVMLVTLMCWLDYETFQLVFVTNQIYDPVTYWLLAIRRLVPVAGS